MALSFNALLRDAGVDPVGVLLLRHRDPAIQRQIYAAAVAADPRFADYQRSQDSAQVVARFKRASHIAGFVVAANGDCVFVGVWEIGGPSGEVHHDPFPGMRGASGEVVMFETRPVAALDEYRGRLVIEWGEGYKAWAQWAGNQDKPIVELRRQVVEPPFPGFLAFQCVLDEVESLPPSWVAALRATCGVYLLTHRPTSDLYVGSASGADGFYGRWLGYQDGNGGNVAMKELNGDAADYVVSILETIGSGQDANAVLASEARWKGKLASRAHGLNRN